MQPDIAPVVEQIKNEENFITKAKLLRFLTVDKEVKIKDVAQMLGMKESYVCHILRLNKLNDLIVDGYYSKLISISHLFIISRLHNIEDMHKAYETVLANNFTVSQTQQVIREMLYKTKTSGEHVPREEIKLAADQIATLYEKGALNVVQTRVKTKCTIELKGSLEETTPVLRQILQKLLAK